MSDNNLDDFAVPGNAVGDQPTATDSLGFAPYVEALAAFLRSDASAPPITVSIEGEWGSGKSSFMMQLEQTIAGSSRWQRFMVRLPKWLGGDGTALSPWLAIFALFNTRQQFTLQFNAWRHDKQDAVWAAFALAMSKRLRTRVGFFRAWAGDFRLFWLRFSVPSVLVQLVFLIALATLVVTITAELWPTNRMIDGLLNNVVSLVGELRLLKSFPFVQAWLKTHGSLGTIALAVIGVVGGLYKIQSPMEKALHKYVSKPGYADHAAFVETFHEDFARVIRAYAGHERVFVFIDDLDRCDVPKAAELMQAINLMIGESGNLVFVLGMDREKVAAGISLKYKDLIAFLPDYQSGISGAPLSPVEPAPVNETPVFGKERKIGQAIDQMVSTPGTSITATRNGANYLRFGSSFLEKFIQLSFAIPCISKTQDFDRFLEGLTPRPAQAKWHTRVMQSWRQTYARVSSGSFGKDINTTSSPGEVSPANSPARASEAREERVQQMQIRIGEDGAGVRVAVEMVSPIFGNNPRRLKQFISTFRLALSIYSVQGIFDLRNDKPLATPQQIAKILAVLMRFPDLRSNLIETPDLFAKLERDALASSSSALLSQPGVRKVLLHGVSLPSNSDASAPSGNPFSLQQLDVSFLLSVLPKRAFTEKPPTSSTAHVGTSSSGEASPVQTSESPNVIASQNPTGVQASSLGKTESYSESEIREFLTRAGRDYENIRRTQQAGGARTDAMTDAVHSIQEKIDEVSPRIIQQILTELVKENSDGSRMVALAIAANQVSSGNMPFLLEFFGRFRTPFEHYWCIRALMAHSGYLTPEQASEIIASYTKNQKAIQSDPGRAGIAVQLFNLAKSRLSSSAPAA